MLPKFLSSTYKQYEDDTSAFVTWLGRAAEDCGYNPNARKGTKQATSSTVAAETIAAVRYAISARELAAQVDAVSQYKANIRMPSNVKIFLKRAIEARKRSEEGDKGGHRLFIKILEDALAKLDDQEDTHGISAKTTINKSSRNDRNDVQTQNRFSHLNVEHADESYHLTPVEIALITRIVYMIRQAEKDLCSTVFPDKADDNSYEAFAKMMVFVEYTSKGVSPVQGSGLDVTPFDRFIFLSTARTLLKFIDAAALCADIKVEWPPIMPLKYMPRHKKSQRDDHILSQLLLELQLQDKTGECNENIGNTTMLEPPEKDIFLRTMQPVWLEGKLSVTSVVTSQILLDILDICPDLPRFQKQLSYASTHVSKSLDLTLLPSNTLVTGGLNWPKSGRDIISRIYETLRSIELPTIPLMKNLLLQINHTSKMHTQTSSSPECRAKSNNDKRLHPDNKTNPDQTRIEFIKPSPAEDFVIAHNPLYSGSVMLKLLLEYHEAGLSLTNPHLSIFAVAHLYNALRQLKMIDRQWPLMERITKLHKRALFADAVPVATKDIAGRFSYRLGTFTKQKLLQEDERYKFHEPTLTTILRSLLDTQLSTSRVLWQIEQHTKQVDDKQQPSTSTKVPKAVRCHTQQVTPKGFIGNVQNMVSQIIDDASIDYISLTRRCIRLLEDLRRMWNIELEAKGLSFRFESRKYGNETIDIELSKVCSRAFEEARIVRDLGIYTYRPGDGDTKGLTGRNKDPDNTDRHGRGLLVASKIFKIFLAKENSDLRFPLASTLADLEPAGKLPWNIHRISSVAELHELFSSATYAVVEFYSETDPETELLFIKLALTHNIAGILTFAKVNQSDMPETAKQYCKNGRAQQTFAFFKEGKRVKVNGQEATFESDRAGLKAACEKLGGLAKKRARQARQAQPHAM
ncbi:hypothetical protein F4677DRAFT_450655 [Hypoxylon crocopeplum]|nr:hypothetical protein F4677DRAFT_450655 [Hypoxylon crocopeplum]